MDGGEGQGYGEELGSLAECLLPPLAYRMMTHSSCLNLHLQPLHSLLGFIKGRSVPKWLCPTRADSSIGHLLKSSAHSLVKGSLGSAAVQKDPKPPVVWQVRRANPVDPHVIINSPPHQRKEPRRNTCVVFLPPPLLTSQRAKAEAASSALF